MSMHVVQSYATAFCEIAVESGKTNRFVEDLETLLPVFSSPEVIQFFKSPIFSSTEKEKVVEQVFTNNVDAALADFLKLLARNGRLGLFPQIIEEFKQNCGDGQGAKKGEVYSSTELSAAEKKNIQDAIEKKLKLQTTLEFKVQPDLVGGIEARVGSYIIEDSLKSNLKTLNDSLKRSAL